MKGSWELPALRRSNPACQIGTPLNVNYVKQGRSLQEAVIALTVSFENVPRLRLKDRVRLERIDDSFWPATFHFGFVEIPDIPSALGGAKSAGLTVLDKPTHSLSATTSSVAIIAIEFRWDCGKRPMMAEAVVYLVSADQSRPMCNLVFGRANQRHHGGVMKPPVT